MRWANGRKYVQWSVRIPRQALRIIPAAWALLCDAPVVRFRLWVSADVMRETLGMHCDDMEGVAGYCEDQIRITKAGAQFREVIVHICNHWVGSGTVAHECCHAAFNMAWVIMDPREAKPNDMEEVIAHLAGWLVGSFWDGFYARFRPLGAKACDLLPSGTKKDVDRA